MAYPITSGIADALADVVNDAEWEASWSKTERYLIDRAAEQEARDRAAIAAGYAAAHAALEETDDGFLARVRRGSDRVGVFGIRVMNAAATAAENVAQIPKAVPELSKWVGIAAVFVGGALLLSTLRRK